MTWRDYMLTYWVNWVVFTAACVPDLSSVLFFHQTVGTAKIAVNMRDILGADHFTNVGNEPFRKSPKAPLSLKVRHSL